MQLRRQRGLARRLLVCEKPPLPMASGPKRLCDSLSRPLGPSGHDPRSTITGRYQARPGVVVLAAQHSQAADEVVSLKAEQCSVTTARLDGMKQFSLNDID